MRIPKLKDSLLPVLILAFVGLAVTFLNPVFNTTTRWAILGVVFAFLLLKGRLGGAIRTHFGLLTLIFALWILTTTIWSEVPMLSGMKAGSFLVIAFTCMAAGRMWVRQHPPRDALNFLYPLTVAALLAGVLGRYSAEAVVESGPNIMYQGFVEGTNMFGTMLAMCSPLILWQIHIRWRNTRQRALWLALGGIALYYLFASSSRGAILIVLCTMLGLFLSLGASRKLRLTVLLVGFGMVVFMLAPGKFEQFQRQYIYKQAIQEEGQGIFFSRVEPWRESYEQAKKGGWMGGGYGVTIGNKEFAGGVTAVGYGREKGNSQLAIAEETGLIGLAIYLVSLFVLFARLFRVVLRWPVGPEKVLLGTVAGALFGMVVHSVFEAWWVAPASPESVYFWSMVGVALGLTRLKPVPAKLTQQGKKPSGNRPAATPRTGRHPVST